MAMKEKASEAELARRAYLILIRLAADRRLITYKLLTDELGVHHRRASRILARTMAWCALHQPKLPPLTALIVNSGRGLPGEGLITTGSLDSDREKVFRHRWIEEHPPTVAELEAAFRERGRLANVRKGGK